MSLAPEKLVQLRERVHHLLKTQNVYGDIRDFVLEFLQQEGQDMSENTRLSPDQLIRSLQEKGVVEDLVKSLMQSTTGTPMNQSALSPSKQYLHLTLKGGRAFAEFTHATPGSNLSVHFQFGHHRFQSKAVPCSCDPLFDEVHLFPFDTIHTSQFADFHTLMELKQSLNIVVVLTQEDHTATVVGTQTLEWRKVLRTGSISLSVELVDPSPESKAAAGVLLMRLDLIPTPTVQVVPENDILSQLKSERIREAEIERQFFLYAKSWWQEYLNQSPSHAMRLVKIFASDETGTNRPVVSFVSPMKHQSSRVSTPMEAARFVSLLSHVRNQGIGTHGGQGSSKSDVWLQPHTFLSVKGGDVENHSILLCSLLLGFGLNAFVALGTDKNGSYAWVVTLDARQRPTFWDALTGDQSIPSSRFQSIGCLFNHQSFYGNVQRDDLVSSCVFDVKNPLLWKGMDPSLLKRMTKISSPHLIHIPQDLSALEHSLTSALKVLVERYRKAENLGTAWDTNLEYLLMPALTAYENEKCHGCPSKIANTLFEESIKGHVPEKYTFKGFPIQFNHTHGGRIFHVISHAKDAQTILHTKSNHTQFALRTRITSYAEGSYSVWVMLAVKFAPNK